MKEPTGRGVRWDSQDSVSPEEPVGELPNFFPAPAERSDRVELPNIEGYAIDEAALFNFVVDKAPYRYWDVTRGDGQVVGSQNVRAAAWTIIYLHSLIAEDKRPKLWIAKAKEKMRSLADFLLSRQAGSPTESSDLVGLIGSTASTETEFGAFLDPTGAASVIATGYSEDVGAGGLALLRAYQVLGDPKYRVGYLDAGKCLRRMQQGGRLTTGYSATDSGGSGRYEPGMWVHRLDVTDPAGQGGGGGGGSLGNAYGIVLTDQGTSSSTDVFANPIGSGWQNWGTGDGQWVLDFDIFPGTYMQAHVACRLLDDGATNYDVTWGFGYGKVDAFGNWGAITRFWEQRYTKRTTVDIASDGTAIAKPTGLQKVTGLINPDTANAATYYMRGFVLTLRFF